eukprot:GHVS01041044.1.p1 GENE.GHVS01041044.1~~GHVS01041044.1.p1  ORF type:complete len:304 (-),score=77.92 GHVS01041044.1:365-1276(-)
MWASGTKGIGSSSSSFCIFFFYFLLSSFSFYPTLLQSAPTTSPLPSATTTSAILLHHHHLLLLLVCGLLLYLSAVITLLTFLCGQTEELVVVLSAYEFASTNRSIAVFNRAQHDDAQKTVQTLAHRKTMGNELSACPCCLVNDPSTAASYNYPCSSSKTTSAEPAASTTTAYASPSSGANQQALNESQRRLVDGVGVCLILQDRSKTACLCKLDYLRGCLLLSCNRKVRSIGLREIRALLHSPGDLTRIEASAGVGGAEDLCVAIQISRNGNCIPIFFHSEGDRRCFVEVIEQEKRRSDEAFV